jgi:protein-export membrane protein SecD
MTNSMLWKLLLVVAALVGSLIALWPSYQFYQLPQATRVAAARDTPAAKLREQSIPLGLDLQGGMHLVLEVDTSKLPPEEAKGAPDRAIEVIRNRVDQFGVAEPIIQKEGLDRIVVQLPGLTDRQRALDIIGKTAELKFQLVRTPDEAQAIFTRLDGSLASRARAGLVKIDSTASAKPLSTYFLDSMGGAGFIASADVPKVEALLTPAVIDSVVPKDSQLLWGDEEGHAGRTGRWLYVVKADAEMGGGSVSNATAQIGLDQNDPGGWGVALKLAGKGQSDFARITAANVGRQLAVVLDSTVRSAPSIRERIPNGNATIHGSFDAKSAKDLEIVLKAGALPAPVHPIEERSVGPSLGQDSIDAGFKAAWVGTLLVVLFMLIYYQGSGVIAVGALLLNLILLFAGLKGWGATLTMPGIAGIVLTIGAAVDTNVLILERIREEMRHGKSIRSAIELGYKNAFRTVLDAHVTMLISAAFLFQFGTGPIKGFAITLALGLVANLFTAVFFTRLVYDMITHRRTLTRLSI